MKKIISAILALIMLLSAFTMIIPAVSADETSVASEKIYAFQSTVNVNGSAGDSEPAIVVQNYLNNGVRFGAAWDYENVYLVFNSVGNAEIKSITLEIGTAKVEINGEVSNSDCNAKVKASKFCAETAIPLSEIVLSIENYEPLASFDLEVKSTLGTDSKNTGLVLSGRNLVYRSGLYDGGSYLGNKSGMGSCHGVVDGQSISNPNTNNIKVSRQGDGSYYYMDAVEGATKVRVQTALHMLYQAVVPEKDGSEYLEVDINVSSLPEVDKSIENPDVIGQYLNEMPYIMILLGLRTMIQGYTDATKVYIHNKAGVGLVLTVSFSENSIDEIPLADLGIGLGDDIKIGLAQNSVNTLDVFVNNILVKSYTLKAYGRQSASSNPGFIIISGQRNYTYGSGDMTEFTVKNISLSVLNTVDVEKVMSLSKNGEEAIVPIQTAGVGPVNFDGEKDAIYTSIANISSLTTMQSAYDTSTGNLSLIFRILGVGKIKLEIGGKVLEVNIKQEDYVYSGTSKVPTLTATVSGINGARVKTNQETVSTFAEVQIPLSALKGERQESGLTLFKLKATVSTFPAYEGYNYGVCSNTSDVNIFVDADAKVEKQPTTMSLAFGRYSLVSVKGVTVSYKDQRTPISNSKALRAYAIESGATLLKTRQDAKLTHNITVAAMPEVSFDDIGAEVSSKDGWISFAKPADPRVVFSANRLNEDGGSDALVYSLYNSDEGLVLAITIGEREDASKKTVEKVKLGKETGEKFVLSVTWSVDDKVEVFVDEEQKASIKKGTAAYGKPTQPAMVTRDAGTVTINFVRCRDLGDDENFEVLVVGTTLSDNYISDDTRAPITLKYVQTTLEKGETFGTRFISSVTIRSYVKVGYEIAVKGSDSVKHVTSDTLYTSFIANGKTINAEKGEYFAILGDDELPVQSGRYTIIVRPYGVTNDGKLHYGVSFALDYENGELVDNGVHNYIYYLPSDLDPFVGSQLIKSNPFGHVVLDENKNSVIYDLGHVRDVNRAVLTSDNDNFKHFNKNSFGLYYSVDNETYTYVKEYSVLTVGNKVYFYNFDVEAKYIKINSTANIEYSGSGRITNQLDSILTVYSSDEPLLAEDEFLMSAEVKISNEKEDTAYNTVFEFTLEDLGINADDIKEDMSDIRFILDGLYLPHYYSYGKFYVRVPELSAGEEATVRVLYNNETALSVSDGNEVFEIQYGTKHGWTNNESGWFNSIATMPNGDLLRIVCKSNTLYYYRSTTGGMTWEPWVNISCAQNIGECGGFLVDYATGKVFYMAYYIERGAKCQYRIFLSEDSGYTWSYVGTPVANVLPVPEYALSYSDGIALSTADGEGPEVDYVFTTGVCRNLVTLAFCTSAFYSKDGGKTWIFSDSRINYNFGETDFGEGGLSEECVYEQKDGTLLFYARCQLADMNHFARSYSYDKGITWTELEIDSLSNVYTVNTQPILETLADGTPILLWGGNNSMGGTSYKRFPLNMAISYDDAVNFVDITDVSFQTVIAQLTRLHTNPDLTFYEYGGIENAFIVSTNHQIYVLNVDDFLRKTKGAFDSFEDADISTEGWLLAAGSAFKDGVGATDGKYAFRFNENTIATRTLHYMEEGRVSFDLYVGKFGAQNNIELQTAFNVSQGVTAPIRLLVDADGKVCYYDESGTNANVIDTGLKLKKGNNTFSIDFNGNEETTVITVNGESAEIEYISGIDNAISYINIFTGKSSDISIDRFIAVRTDK